MFASFLAYCQNNFGNKIPGVKKGCLQLISGVFLLPNDSIQEVYDGIWGYSAILSMCALSCVFFALSQMSVVLALVNVLGTIGVQYGLRTTLSIQV